MKTIVIAIFSFLGLVNSFGLSPKFVKEAEIKHGRVAMLSSVAIPLLDNVKEGVLGVNFVSSLSTQEQLGLLATFGLSEFCQIFKAYEYPTNTSKFFQLKEDHTPGDYGFDPLGLSASTKAAVPLPITKETDRAVETVLGRLAMLGVACEMANELGTGNPVF